MATARKIDCEDSPVGSPDRPERPLSVARSGLHHAAAPTVATMHRQLEASFAAAPPLPAIRTWPGAVRVAVLLSLVAASWSPIALLRW